MASFFIINDSRFGCSYAYDMLWTAWKMNLLNTKFVCIHWTNRLLIFGYNPYTRQAPRTWQHVSTYRGVNDHPWTLFMREYQEKRGICDELEFQKNNDLEGYVIQSSVRNVAEWWRTDPKKTGVDSFGKIGGVIAGWIFSALNATPQILIRGKNTHLGTMNASGYVFGQLLDVINGTSDIVLVP